jgi:hypothetical protein
VTEVTNPERLTKIKSQNTRYGNNEKEFVIPIILE